MSINRRMPHDPRRRCARGPHELEEAPVRIPQLSDALRGCGGELQVSDEWASTGKPSLTEVIPGALAPGPLRRVLGYNCCQGRAAAEKIVGRGAAMVAGG